MAFCQRRDRHLAFNSSVTLTLQDEFIEVVTAELLHFVEKTDANDE